MTKSKHTPGPWVVGPVDDTVVTHLGTDGIRYTVAEIDGDYNQPETWPIMEANARLIAAAPDMLMALKTISLHVTSLDDAGVREFCDEAIAKATTP